MHSILITNRARAVNVVKLFSGAMKHESLQR